MSIKEPPLAIVVGAGPGLGQALAEQLDANGYRVVGLARSENNSKRSEMEKIVLDTTDPSAVSDCIQELISKYGAPDVVIHNTAQLVIKPFLDTTSDEFKQVWNSMVLSAFTVMQHVLPAMANEKRGTVIVSGATASLRGGSKFSAFASAKFALRGLTQSLAREFQPQGIHIAHVIIDGILDTEQSRNLHSLHPDRMMNTADVAQAYMQLIAQNPSAWSNEIDLRPSSESF